MAAGIAGSPAAKFLMTYCVRWFFLGLLIALAYACGMPKEVPPNTIGWETLRAARKIIYVSQMGNDKASGSRSSPLATIQEAIHRAQPSDAIKVMPGTYHENIELKTGVNLIGSGSEATTITAIEGNVITAKGIDKVIVEGFTLDGQDTCNVGFLCDQCHRSRDGVILRRNRIVNINGHGIQYMYSNGIIEDNIVTSTTRAGIYCEVVNAPWYPRIRGNTISQAGVGISLMAHIRSIVQENTIKDVSGVGIGCSHGTTAVIEDNVISNVGEVGISCYLGSRPIIRRNRIESCGKSGVSCLARSGPKLRWNIITRNRQYGIYIEADCSPDLGREDDRGVNAIYNNVTHDIYSLAPHLITAVGNWWGNSPPRPEQFYGNVDYGMALEEQPAYK